MTRSVRERGAGGRRFGRIAAGWLALALVPSIALAGTHQLLTFTDNSADTELCTEPTTVLMATITTAADKGGNKATDTTVSVGGTVVAADVAAVRVYYGGALQGQGTNPASLSNLTIPLVDEPKGGLPFTYELDLYQSAAAKTFNLTVHSIAGTDNAVLPATTTTRNASSCTANSPPTVTIGNPSNGSSIGGPGPYTIDGTASDSDGTVTSVRLQIQRGSDYWNDSTSSWTATPTWVPDTALTNGGGWATWSYDWAWTADMEATAVSVTAEATDDLSGTGTDTNGTTVDTLAPRIPNGVRFQTATTSGDVSFT